MLHSKISLHITFHVFSICPSRIGYFDDVSKDFFNEGEKGYLHGFEIVIFEIPTKIYV